MNKIKMTILLGIFGLLIPTIHTTDLGVTTLRTDSSSVAGVCLDLEDIRQQATTEASQIIKVAEAEEQAKQVEEDEYPEEVELEEPNYIYIRCTGYTLQGITASGNYVYSGCVATCDAWFGHDIDLYTVNEDGSVGEYINTYHADDKGGYYISSGQRIDVWFPSYSAACDFISKYGDYVYMVVKGE